MDQVDENPADNRVEALSHGLRNTMISRVVTVIVPRPDVNANYDARMIDLKEYCKYMERKAFERAETKDEYYAAMANLMINIQRKLEERPKGDPEDPYSDIPLLHEMADFMGMTEEEIEEFDEEQNPQGPSDDEDPLFRRKLTPAFREHVVDKLGTLLFPAPDAFARYDGRMDTVTEQLHEIEEESYALAEDIDDYYNRASLKAHRLRKEYKKTGKSYMDRVVWHPVINFRTEIVDYGCMSPPVPE